MTYFTTGGVREGHEERRGGREIERERATEYVDE